MARHEGVLAKVSVMHRSTYFDRIRAFYLASLAKFQDSMLRENLTPAKIMESSCFS
ncbi:hypothetical protein WN943_023755 [Citrus x changshan-huyou]